MRTQTKYTFEYCKEQSLKYRSKKEWREKDRNSYRVAADNGWLAVLCMHMAGDHILWTKELSIPIAKKYTTRRSFELGDKKCYQASCRNGWLDEICQHMKPPGRKIPFEVIHQAALTCETLVDFRERFESYYITARKNKWMDQVGAHFIKKPHRSRVFTKEVCKQRSQSFNNRNAFWHGDQPAYGAALRHGWLDEICQHMKTPVGTSSQELEISDFIKSLGLETTKLWIKDPEGRRQVDIFVEKKNIGIEYCGMYWHNEDSPQPRNKKYHYNKMKLCNEQGIQLITIFEDEWLYRRCQVENFLKSKFGCFEKTVFARKTNVRQIDKDAAKEILNNNHIQGAASASLVHFGLFFEDNLIAIMTGGRHHRGSKNKKQLVLDRFVVKNGINLPGGASKLFSQLKKWACQNGYEEVISWSDNRWSEGNVYKKLNFLIDSKMPPDYSYVKGRKRFSKQSLKKTEEERLSGKTEKELRKEQGYSRIWDCGKIRWVYKL